ncbi:vacuolar ATPase assembly integral membrane protein vma21 [Coemansia sp. IMI 203386]|nr:vacuolar ATPase assembly integral membrane protein vma21 [Coemansia sp. IMI 203386]
MPNTRKSKTHKGSSAKATSTTNTDTAGSSNTTRRRLPKTSASNKDCDTDTEERDEDKVDDDDEETGQQEALVTPNIPSNVVAKLVSFSALLLVAPILCYFVSLKYIFVGATASSAIVAVIAANLVLAAFVYSAWNEELDDRQSESKNKNS